MHGVPITFQQAAQKHQNGLQRHASIRSQVLKTLDDCPQLLRSPRKGRTLRQCTLRREDRIPPAGMETDGDLHASRTSASPPTPSQVIQRRAL